MATLKVKLRKSTIEHKAGSLFIQLIHQREVRLVTTRFKLYPCEWNERKQAVIVNEEDMSRIIYLYNTQKEIDAIKDRIHKIIKHFESKGAYHVSDLAEELIKGRNHYHLSVYMNKRIREIETEGRGRTAQTYRTTLNTFLRFRNGEDVDLEYLDSDMMCDFENHLKSKGLCRNTTSFYMRILSAAYNQAVKRKLCEDKRPFRDVYLGVDKTVKRAVDENVIEKLIRFDTDDIKLRFARDMFLFSYYCRGIAFVDLFHLRKENISNGILSYFRSKTKQHLSIKMEHCMQEIIDRYKTKNDSLFPFNESKSKNGKHTTALWLYNVRLKIISEQLKLNVKLSSYVSRHTWASIAKRKGITTSIISECMGHTNEKTTQIYLASFPQGHLDKANKIVLGIGKKKTCD